MNFLIDENLPSSLVDYLRIKGHTALHVQDAGLAASADSTILRSALENHAVVVTHDGDFPQMLALSRASGPSVILLRGDIPDEPEDIAILISSLSPEAVLALEDGAVVSIDARGVRVRRLPLS